ncbi:MAG: T9SS type A sorting domain-containing protein [Bacteroidales bacterium]|nr:T9SS type A sorting domain-containing protein [Bacteroidales bacterium]MCF8392088.1 T9SS type A sorting domain-containing protein [Bacteroidales bacterium]
MQNKLFTTKIKSIVILFLLFFGTMSTSFAQNTIEVSGSCITDTVVLSEVIVNDGKMAYTGTGTIFGIENTPFALWWDAAEAKWLLALDGQAYWYNSDDTDLPNSTLLIGNWTQDDLSIGTCDLIIEGSGTNMPVCVAPEPATQVSFGMLSDSSIQINSLTAPAGGADGYVIKVNTSNSFTSSEDAASLPVSDSVYGGGEQVVYAGTSGSDISITGLNSGSNYFFKVFAYNYCSDLYTFETTGLLAEQTTLKADQTISFDELEAKTYGDADFDLTATASSDLAVTYVSSNTEVASVLGNIVTIVGQGTTDITASQSGNTGFNPAPDVIRVLSVKKKVLSITGSFGVADKEFDGNTVATITENNLTLLSVINNDAVELTNPEAKFAQTEVGENIVVSLTGASLTGADMSNYILTLENSPTTTASITFAVNVKDAGSTAINVYPNPFSEAITIVGSTSVSKIKLIDLTGKILIQKSINGYGSINTSQLKSGVYFLSIEDAEHREQVIRLIKE